MGGGGTHLINRTNNRCRLVVWWINDTHYLVGDACNELVVWGF